MNSGFLKSDRKLFMNSIFLPVTGSRQKNKNSFKKNVLAEASRIMRYTWYK